MCGAACNKCPHGKISHGKIYGEGAGWFIHRGEAGCVWVAANAGSLAFVGSMGASNKGAGLVAPKRWFGVCLA